MAPKKRKNDKFLATAPGTKAHRVEFIETQKYINGVRNERNGPKVIRPLNEDEKEFLSKFNATFEHGNFDDDFLSLSEDQRSEINHQDYARKMDLMFVAKKAGQLITYDLGEYDKLTTEMETGIEPEDLLNEHLVDKPKKSLRIRRKLVNGVLE